jgi:hypothetical protein
MANFRTIQQSFAGGEIGEDMYSRVEDGKHRTGAARVRNMIVRPTGTVASRPGFKLVAETKTSADQSWLIPFRVSATETIHLEFGEAYIRFHTEGGAVVLDSTPPAYKPNRTFNDTDVDAAFNDDITFAVSHGFATADPLLITTDNAAALPGPLAVGTTYYAIVMSATEIKLATTAALAIAGTAMNLTNTGGAGGQFRANYAYQARDLVSYSGSNWYCISNPTLNGAPQFVPGTVTPGYWHELTDDIYEIPSPYSSGRVDELQHDQSGDVMTIVHHESSIRELRRYGNTSWQLVLVSLAGSVEPPTSVAVAGTAGINLKISAATTGGGVITEITTGTAEHRLGSGDVIYLSGLANSVPGVFSADGYYSVGSSSSLTKFVPVLKDGAGGVTATGTYVADSGRVAYVGSTEDATNYYVVTAVGEDGRESVASTAGNATNNLFVRDAYNTITWVASTTAGVQRYHVYKRSNGLYGYIGQVDANEALSFKDDSIDPDLGRSPPILDDSLDAAFPAAVAHFEQRRLFAATDDAPQQVWGSRSGTESDFGYHIPVQDDDRISFAIASREPATIKHIVPIAQLLLLTESGEYRVTPVNSDAITPTSIAVRAQSYIGSSSVPPLIVNTTVLFCAARGGHVRELGFSAEVDSYLTGDVSIRASHLFDGQEITSSALCKAPYPIAWFTSDSGLLLGFTYVPEEGVGAWHWHDTDGTIECVSAGPEGSEDRVYVIVRRTINGQTVRTVERMGSMAAPAALEDAFCVDCGATYDGAAATTISGLTHLVGEAVSVLADGRVVTGKTVSASGTITLSTAASVVHVGLPYTCDLQTLPIAVQVEAFSHGRTKNVNRVWLRCTDSGAFDVGPDTSRLRSSDPRGENAGTYMSGQIPVPVDGKWTDDGQVWLRQSDPLPVTVVGQVVEVSIGG